MDLNNRISYMEPNQNYKNFVEVIAEHAEQTPKKKALTFIPNRGEAITAADFGNIYLKATAVAGCLKRSTKPGDRALLIFEKDIEFAYAFMGCLFAGVIAVPVFPPTFNNMMDRLKHIIKDAAPGVCLMDNLAASFFKDNDLNIQSYGELELINTEELDSHWADRYTPLNLDHSSLAFLQYTSGSTGNPKGVMVTHGNLIHNQAITQYWTGHTQDTVMVNSLPLYHDMGLVGSLLHAVYVGFSLVLIPNQLFLRSPLSWLKTISDYKGNTSGGPNFFYELCIRAASPKRLSKLDLSHWNIAFVGAEPVRYKTLQRFAETFAPCGFKPEFFFPCYGMAETTLTITANERNRKPPVIYADKAALSRHRVVASDKASDSALTLIGNGINTDDHEIKIVNPITFRCSAENEVGEIWAKGPAVTVGYWKKEDLTEEVFGAHLISGEGPYLRTGDLGFFHKGALYCSGRLKDVIIINGRNYYPQDIETLVENCHSKIRFGRVAAFSFLDDIKENLCIVAEYKGKKEAASEVFNAVRLAISQSIGIKAAEILLVKAKTLPFTTSGKVRRSAAKDAYLAGRLEIIAAFPEKSSDHGTPQDGAICENDKSEADIIDRILKAVSKRLQLPVEDIDLDAPLGQYGLSSMDAVELAAELEKFTGNPFPPTLIYQHPTIHSLAELISKPVSNNHARQESTLRAAGDEPIAIIGMACNFPSAPHIDAFWKMLDDGIDAFSPIPTDRPGFSFDGLEAEHPACRWGAFIKDVAGFDAKFFGLSPAEVEYMDPQHRKMMEVFWGTIENAGYHPSYLADTNTGVYTGISSNDYSQMVCSYELPVNAYTATGLSQAMLSNRLSYFFNLHGPSETIDTACSSALVAVHRAVQSLRNGECQQAIAGGVNLILSPHAFLALNKTGFLSEDGVCKAFDASANGYVRGEGAGAVFLKPLSKAVADKDFIHAVIKGSAINHGGRTASLTSPSERAQADLLKTAYRNAGVATDTITYVEAHGTGTVLGDPIEINGLKQAFLSDNGGEDQERINKYCGVGTVKTNIGHLEAAAGIAGLIKTVLALKYKTIPATLHFNQQNPYIDIENTHFYFVREKTPWTKLTDKDDTAIPRRAGVSSFGFGGTNAHVVLEEAPEMPIVEKEGQNSFLILLSAKSDSLLKNLIRQWIDFIDNEINSSVSGNIRLADIAYTLQTGRTHQARRAAIISNSKAGLKLMLNTALSRREEDELFFFEGAGALGYRRLKELGDLAESWLQGKDIDWQGVNRDQYVKRVPLPGYQFDRKPYWAPIELRRSEAKQIADTDREPAPAEKSFRPVSIEEVTRWLVKQTAEHCGIQIEEIDPHSTFEELGLDSIALINIHGRIQGEFNKELDISVIQEYPNIDALAKLIAEEKVFEIPDLNNEFSEESEKFKATLKKSIETSIPPMMSEPGKAVLLTGATGFLGSFLLKQLIQGTDAKIYCIVRAETEADGIRRIEDRQEKFQITDCPLNQRMQVLCGDLGKERFGFDQDVYDALSRQIDTVFHCGAIVDWMKPYMSLKKTNVGGTVEAIKFCSTHKIKQLHYVSSLAVLPLIEERPKWLESDQPDPEKLTNGYAQSKWVAERLCLEARNLGLPVNIFRFDYVAASTATGAMKETDFIVRLIKGCIQLGSIPVEEVNFDILSIDYLSRILLQLSKLNQSKTYHLINRQPFTTSDFAKVIRSSGYALERIPFSTWKNIIKGTPGNELYPLYPFINQYSTYQLTQYHLAIIDNTNTLTALYEIDPKLISEIPSAEAVMTKTMSYFRESGHLPAIKFKGLLRRQQAYWQKQLEEAPGRLSLPFSSTKDKGDRPAENYLFDLEGDVLEAAERFSRDEGVSIAETFLAVFHVLLSRYTRQKVVPVTVPLAVKSIKNNHFLPKMPVINLSLGSGNTFREVVLSVKQLISEAQVHLDLPSDDIAHNLYSRSGPIGEIEYDTVFIWIDEALKEHCLNLDPLKIEDVPQKFSGLRLILQRKENAVKASLEYDGRYFEQKTISQMAAHFEVLLNGMGKNPDADVFKLPIMPAEEQEKILHQWNTFQKDYPSKQLVHELISKQAKIRPDAVALRMGAKSMTYQALDNKSKLFSDYLRQLGVLPGELIGVCMEKGFELMIGLLGILKAGGAYFPVDPTYPEDRKRYMIDVAEAKFILGLTATKDQIPDTEAEIICLDDDWEKLIKENDRSMSEKNESTLQSDNDADKIAYMIFTSGSTGRPKGVKVYHRGLVNLLYAYNEDVGIDHNDCVLTCASLSYDASVIEMFYPLVHGGSLAMVTLDVSRDGQRLKKYLDRNSITFMTASVATWRMLDYAGWQGSPKIKIVNGGEVLPYELAQTLIGWSKTAYNGYGPAETSVCATMKRLEPNRPVTIGRPLANTQIYILDECLNPMPVGAAGELHIGGAGVAHGYHNRPEMTESKFIPNPFKGDGSTEKMYKTGDLARYLPNGEIEFIGRIDNQVKIRGHRIELGEIENLLGQNNQVKACTVLVRQEPDQEKKLVAYLIPSIKKEQVNIFEIKEALKRELPSFMMPSDYVVMEAFPVTLGGKVDRTAFPLPAGSALLEDFVPPSTSIERQLSDIWKDLLNLDRVGIQNSFLDLGGDSLKAMKLLISINRQFDVGLTVQALYENLTIEKLSRAILNGNGTSSSESILQAVDYDSEASFDIEFDPLQFSNLPIVPTQLKRLFITGATGYLGAFILESILTNTSANVYCLVRADTPAKGMERIKNNLEKSLIWKDAYRRRIKPVVGDLALPNFGIPDEKFELLAKYIDAVYHCGSIVNFAYPYSFLKKTNVEGTKEVIKFSTCRRIKHLFYVSTIGVFEQSDLSFSRDISENDELPDPEGLFFGYSQSKWIAEKIMLKAMEEGLPISIYRPGSVLGHSVTGVSNLDDLVNVIIKVINRVGAIPDVDFHENGLPVDVVADTIVKLSFMPESTGRRFHIINPKDVAVKDMIDYYLSYGYRMPVLPYRKWRDLLIKKAESDDYLLPYVSVVEKELSTMDGSILPNFLFDNTRRLLTDYDQTAPEIDEKLFHTYLRYLENVGFIPKPGQVNSTLAA